ncbi:MAG: hypothetical protein Q8Q20_00215 [bacterium]|nr:hypothetical protein [bacterium]
MKRHGFLIAIYGVNNLGKTTQAEKLVDFLNRNDWKADQVKYPVYRLKPSGVYINQLLRKNANSEISEEELQMWFTINRFQHEELVKKKIESGHIVVAEDYVGTGLAWGATRGAKLDWLIEINKPLLKEDLAILFDGKRFKEAKEKNHRNEQDDVVTERCRRWHQKLADMYGWKRVDANQSVSKVHDDVLEIVSQFLRLQDIWKK